MARIFLTLCIIFFLALTTITVPVESERPPIPFELQRLYNTGLENWTAPKEILRDYPFYLSGFDEDNHAIWVLEFGKWDLRSIVEKGAESVAAFDKYVDQGVMIVYNSSLTADGVSPVIGIVDFDGYTIDQLKSTKTLEYIIQKLRLFIIAFSNVQSAFFINVNFFGEKILNLLRPVLGKEFEKFEIFGTNSAKWRPKLLKVIPRDQLASWYGGEEDFKPVRVYG